MLFRVDCANPCREKAQLTGVCTEGFQRAIADFVRFHCPFVASAEAKSPACGKDQLCLKDQLHGRAHLARHSIGVGKSSLGAHLRMREVTGRDASLPALLLSAFGILVARGTIGALPQTPPEALPLDSARGNFSLDPFRAIELVAFPILLPRVYSSFAACSMFFRAAESISFTRLS